MAVATSAKKRLSKISNNTPERAHVGTKEPKLPTLYGFLYIRVAFHFRQEWTLSETFAHTRLCAESGAIINAPNNVTLAHHSTIAGNSGKAQMRDSLRREYYWPKMSIYVYNTVQNCQDTPRMGKNLRHQCQLQLIPLSSPLELIEIDITGPIPRTQSGNQFMVIITDRCSNLTQDVPTLNILSTQNACIVFNHLVNSYGISDIIMSNNGQQFFSNVFISLRNYHGVKKLRLLRIICRQIDKWNDTTSHSNHYLDSTSPITSEIGR